MKDTEKLNNIRMQLIDNFFMNEDFIFAHEIEYSDVKKILSVIAGLYEELHKTTTGEDYDYFWHYFNKVTCDVFDTYKF